MSEEQESVDELTKRCMATTIARQSAELAALRRQVEELNGQIEAAKKAIFSLVELHAIALAKLGGAT